MQSGAGWGRLYDPGVASTPQSSDSFSLRFSELTEASPTRPRDAALRAFDIALSAFFLLVSLPLTVPIAGVLLVTSGRPLFYRGERVGRGGRVFEMLKFRTLSRERGGAARPLPRRGARPAARAKRRPRSVAGYAQRSWTRFRSSGTSCAAT